MYSPRVIKLFQDVRFVGDIPDANAYVTMQERTCNDMLHLAVKARGGVVTAVRFRAKGCVAAVACAAQLAEMMQKKALTELRTLSAKDIASALGGLPVEQQHASDLAIRALQAMLNQL
jgi:nitrogen fixation NifU-like protein